MLHIVKKYDHHYYIDSVIRRVCVDRKSLERKLEQVRQRMIRSGIENGLQSPKTIRLSKQLDHIMNQYTQPEIKAAKSINRTNQ